MKYWSIRKVGIKELWMLKWHHQFDTGGVWTKAGASSAGQLAQMDEKFQRLLANNKRLILPLLIPDSQPFCSEIGTATILTICLVL